MLSPDLLASQANPAPRSRVVLIRSVGRWLAGFVDALDYDSHAHAFERMTQMEEELRDLKARVGDRSTSAVSLSSSGLAHSAGGIANPETIDAKA